MVRGNPVQGRGAAAQLAVRPFAVIAEEDRAGPTQSGGAECQFFFCVPDQRIYYGRSLPARNIPPEAGEGVGVGFNGVDGPSPAQRQKRKLPGMRADIENGAGRRVEGGEPIEPGRSRPGSLSTLSCRTASVWAKCKKPNRRAPQSGNIRQLPPDAAERAPDIRARHRVGAEKICVAPPPGALWHFCLQSSMSTHPMQVPLESPSWHISRF